MRQATAVVKKMAPEALKDHLRQNAQEEDSFATIREKIVNYRESKVGVEPVPLVIDAVKDKKDKDKVKRSGAWGKDSTE